VRGGLSFLKPRDMHDTAFRVHLFKLQGASFRHTQTVPKHHEQQTAVAGLEAAALWWRP